MHTLDVDGAGRSYRLYKPVGLPSSAPLVVMLHGGFGSAKQAERSYGWDELADSEKFLVAYPDGYHRAWNANGGGCCGRPAREGVDDIGFVRAVVADIANNVSIDPARVYVTGMSNGAIMSYTLACNTSIFAAIGVVSGTQLDPVSPRVRCRSSTSMARPIRWSATTAGPAPGSRASTVRRCPISMRSGARSTGAARWIPRPKVRSPHRAPHAPTIAVSCCSPSMTPATDGRHLPPRHCGDSLQRTSDEDKTIRYILLCSCRKT